MTAEEADMRLESKRASVPSLFLELGNKVGALLAEPAVAAKWNEPSALEGMTVGALAAHLGRAFTTTWLYVQADPCGVAADVDASTYFHQVFDRPTEEIDDLNANIAQRAQDDADGGAQAVIDLHNSTVADLRIRLIGEPAERGIEVFGDLCMQLDDYLVTRLVEAVVHSDDLAVSVGVDTPAFAPDVVDLVMVTMLGVARERHGDIAMLREFARGERASGSTLPVF